MHHPKQTSFIGFIRKASQILGGLLLLGFTPVLLAAPPADENYDDDTSFSTSSNQFDLDGVRYTITGNMPNYQSMTDNDIFVFGLSSNFSDYYLVFDVANDRGVSSIRIEATDGSAFRLLSLAFHELNGNNFTITPYKGGVAGTHLSYNGANSYAPNLTNNTAFQDITSIVISGVDLIIGLDDLDFDTPLVADSTPPAVNSITLSGSPAANAASVSYTVSFNETAEISALMIFS